MKILIATPQFLPEQNGVSQVVDHHVREFARRGHHVSVATSRQLDQPEHETMSGVDVYRFAASGSAYPRTRYQGETYKYTEFLAHFDCDIAFFHCWQTWTTDMAILAFSKMRAKKVLVSHGVSANALGKTPRNWLRWCLWRPYVWWTMPAILAVMDHLVLLSSDKRRDTFSDYGLTHRRDYNQLSVISNGADLEELDAAPSTFRRDLNIHTPTMLLCVGNYDERKNQLATLEAFIQSRLHDTTLAFIGSERNDYCKKLERAYNRAKGKLRTSPILFCEGLTRKQLFSAYKSADIIVSSSKWECLPLVLLDALGAGKPFISYDVGCVSELPGGLCVNNTMEMAAAMAELARDKNKCQALGRTGRQACELKYNWVKVGDCYEQLAMRLLSGPSAALLESI